MSEVTFQTLKKNLKKDFSAFKSIRVAVLGDSATQMYSQAIKGYGYEMQLNIDIYEADYNQIELQLLDSESDLYRFEPEYIIVFYSTNELLTKFYSLRLSERTEFSQRQLNNVENLYENIISNIKSKVIFFNFPEINDSVFGNYSNKTNNSFIYQLRKINYELMNMSQKFKNFYILDLSVLQSQYGHQFLTDNKIFINTKLLFSIDFLPIAAKNTIDIIQANNGVFKKCIILDLDNTLWGGVIGDDGIENIEIGEYGIGRAFTEFQMWLKQLKERGIILAVCSKNDEKVAKEPFIKHPDMILKIEDIAVFIANWDNKANNIKYIQGILNIGFDSMVFLDDNPFERNMVRTHIKDITVPELPEDPSEYLNYLRKLNLFETASFTEEDGQRTKQYQEEANRSISLKQFINESDFLMSLDMRSLVEPFNKFNTPRVAQLTQRSNQFNLRTIRYTDEDITKIANDVSYITLAFSLKDKFGEYGLISSVILKLIDNHTLFIDTWIMSCRVLKRGMENFVLNYICSLANAKGYTKLIGEYIPSSKNNMVKDHYRDLDFVSSENKWSMNIQEYEKKDCFIKNME